MMMDEDASMMRGEVGEKKSNIACTTATQAQLFACAK